MKRTCKDCWHFEACKYMYEAAFDQQWFHFGTCDRFKDRSRFVELPCKPLDTVYFFEFHVDGNHQIRSGFASSVEYFACYKPLVTIRYNDNTLESTKHYLELNAFMTREEAEAELARRTANG